MKRVLLAVAFIAGMVSASDAFATPQTISDDYWGGTPTDGVDRDVIGSAGRFDVDSMTVDFTATGLTATIYTNYINFIGDLGTQLGDLFISTNGWNPFGTAPYADDDASNGEQWELAAVLSDHTGGTTSGALNVYSVIQSNIVLSSLAGDTFRQGQEVQYAPNGQQALYTGTWSIVQLPNTDLDALVFNLNFGQPVANIFSGPSGFRWGTTCANDVIEGGTPVPEPMTLALLGGALGLVPFRRRARKA